MPSLTCPFPPSHRLANAESTDLPAYAELLAISNYSFLQGGSHPEELVERAQALGYSAITISDECSLAGVVRAHVRAKQRAMPLIIGSQCRMDQDRGPRIAHVGGHPNAEEVTSLPCVFIHCTC